MSKATLDSIRAAKRALRKATMTRLRALPESVIADQSARVTAHVLASRYWREARRISIYLSTDTSELRTDALISAALQSEKAVFVPHCPTADTMRMLRLKDLLELQALVKNKWGIREHVDVNQVEEALDDATAGLDLIIAPGVAFDRRRNRLGHGRGYYDRYIERATTHAKQHGLTPPTIVAVALREQLVKADQTVPFTSQDRVVDAIVHPDGILDADNDQMPSAL